MKVLGIIIFFAVAPILGLLASPLLTFCAMLGMIVATPIAKYLSKKDEGLEQDLTRVTQRFIAQLIMGIPAGAALFVDAYFMHRWFGTNALLLLILASAISPFLDFPGSLTAIPVMFAMYWLIA